MMELTQSEKMMLAAKQQILLRKLIHDENKNKFYVVNAVTRENRGSTVIDPYDLTDEEYDTITEETHDNLVRSLVEASGEIRELRELLARVYEQLLLLGYDSGFTNEEIHKLINDINKYLEEIYG